MNELNVDNTTGLVFAHKNVTDGLYKFRPYRTKADMERVEDILKGNFYFSTYSQLNDPFEMRLTLTPEENSDLRRKRILQTMAAHPNTKNLSPAERLTRSQQYSNRMVSDQRLLEGAGGNHMDRLKSQVFIYCASATRTHPLLWSHYADSHTGLCIKLDHKKVPFTNAAQVQYSEEFPHVTYPFNDDFAELTTKSVLTKAEFWAYEKEYRLFSVRMGNDGWHLGLKWIDEHRAQIGSKIIAGVTFGARMPEERKKGIADYCESQGLNIPFANAEICDDRFELRFVPYSPKNS